MADIKKWEPMRELSTIQREMDDLFRRAFGFMPGFFREWRTEALFPTIDAYMKGDKFILRADLPGIDPNQVDVSVTGNQLTIRGERKAEKEEKKPEYFFHETSYGSFERTITLPEGVDTRQVSAVYKKGVLELTMPAKAEALPKKVKIEVEGEKAA